MKYKVEVDSVNGERVTVDVNNYLKAIWSGIDSYEILGTHFVMVVLQLLFQAYDTKEANE